LTTDLTMAAASDDQKIIKQINTNLGRCYEKNKDQSGWKEYEKDYFLTLCEDNGFDDDTSVLDELSVDVDDSQLVDEDFIEELCPWISTDDMDKRKAKIFNILKKCSESEHAFDGNEQVHDYAKQKSWQVTKQDIRDAIREAEKQAQTIVDGGFRQDDTLCFCFAVSVKQNIPYLQYLVDMFQRQRIDAFASEGQHKYNEAQWAKENQHIQLLKKDIDPVMTPRSTTATNIEQLIQSAVRSFLHRVAPKLLLIPQKRIKADLETVVMSFQEVVVHVSKLAEQNGPKARNPECPFQFDAVFVFKEETSAEDEDSDDENESKSQSGDSRNLPDFTKLQGLMDTFDMKHVTGKFEGRNRRKSERLITEKFVEFRNKYKGQLVDENPFPHRKRTCALIDFRVDLEAEADADSDQKADDRDKEVHNLLFFGPKEKIDKDNVKDDAELKDNEVHKEPLALNFFHNMRNTIPVDPDADALQSPEVPEPVLNAWTTGPVVQFSFHVLESNDIRCYFYINGQCSRFMAHDLKNLLPIFFVGDGNDKFKGSKEMDKIVDNVGKLLKDEKFEGFLKDSGVQYPYSAKSSGKE